MIAMGLGDRMKEYENAYRTKMTRRMPVLLRIDGCHFHTYTAGMEKPFEQDLAEAFWETCKYLTENIAGCKIAYHQSDEISLLVTNYHKLTTESWYGNNIQKIVSVAASLATAKFNEVMRIKYPEKELATFDARAWILPKDEVCNYFLWRQRDATKNSISMVAQAHFTDKELHGLNGNQKKDKLLLEKNINWNELPVWKKRGVCITEQPYMKGNTQRNKMDVDHKTPIFSQDRNFIERYVFLPE
jgi:tRNA(His) 5'-end guanylyltransferase